MKNHKTFNTILSKWVFQLAQIIAKKTIWPTSLTFPHIFQHINSYRQNYEKLFFINNMLFVLYKDFKSCPTLNLSWTWSLFPAIMTLVIIKTHFEMCVPDLSFSWNHLCQYFLDFSRTSLLCIQNLNPEKMVPGKMVPGKMVPGKLVAEKMVPGLL